MAASPAVQSAAEITRRLKQRAAELGFGLSGACPAVTPAGLSRLHEWLDAGYDGQMRYIEGRREAYAHPRSVLDGVRSMLMLGMMYRADEPLPVAAGEGRVARYAWGEADYHDVIHERMERLRAYFATLAPGASVRGVVDTAPLLEREFARLSGVGWIGKNTMLLNKQAGSYFFLAALLTDVELDYDAVHEADHCGTCRACLDACPTDAFPEPYVLDARRCISYLTIELRESIPRPLRRGVGDWLFGCDICQQVCPWNRRSPGSEESAFQPRRDLAPVDLAGLFRLSDRQFRERFRRTPLWRARRRGILRNAAIVLGNQRPPQAIEALKLGLEDEEPLVRAACAWALGQYRSAAARDALHRRVPHETDHQVRQEIDDALASPKK